MMAISVGSIKAIDCGVGVSAPSTSNLQVDSLETIRCGIGMDIRDDVSNADLENLLNKIRGLEASAKSDRESIEAAIALIQTQIGAPFPIKDFWASLRNIAEGAAGSMLYTAICALAQT